jgi:hypothetical protein
LKRFPFRRKKKEGKDDTQTSSKSSVGSTTQQAAESTESTTTASHQERDTPAGESKSSIQDPLGLQVVYKPEEEHQADLVFIHGLGGRATWSHNRDPRNFWPLRFLPGEKDIDKLRILTFGYNANFRPGSGESKLSIIDFAKDLLFHLKFSQDDSESAPDSECASQRVGEVRVPREGLVATH